MRQRSQNTEARSVPFERDELRAMGKKRRKPLWKRRLVTVTLVSSDVVLAFLIWGLANALRGLLGQGDLSGATVAAIVPSVAVWVGLRALSGMYPGYGLDQVEGLRRSTYAVLATAAIVVISATAFHVVESLSRLQLALGFLGLLVTAPLVQNFAKWVMRGMGIWGKPVMIIGSGQNDGRVRNGVARLLEERWELGYNPVAVFNFRLHHLTRDSESQGSPSFEETSEEVLTDAAEAARGLEVDTAIFATPHIRREQLAKLVGWASIWFRHVLVIPNLSGITNSAVVARDLAGTFAVEIKHNLLNPWALRAKRVIDLGATIIGGALILPLILVLALLVYVESGGGPVFYRDRRMGRDGSPFSCIKFRTMVPDAEDILQRMLTENDVMREEYSKYHKLRDDPRVTRVGNFLRKTSLDELPQLWNVVRGEMSLVGPRPYLPRESLEIGVTQGEILRVPPGITGPWQVAGRAHTSFEERVQMDAYYVRDWSVWLDIVLLARTVRSVVLGQGAY